MRLPMGALPPFVYIVLALGSFAIAGALLVWVVDYIRGGGSRRRKEPPAGVEPAPAGEQELLRVSRTRKDGLAVYAQGQRYRHLHEIADPQVGRETVEALKAVLAFAEGWLPTPSRPPVQPAPREPTVDEATFLERLRRGDVSSPRGPSGPSLLEPVIPVEHINDLVQERLREQPGLAGRRICLTTEVDGSLRIYVGQQTFEAVDDIPEPAVRALIRDAIREWEGG
jgi:hypothetical protein